MASTKPTTPTEGTRVDIVVLCATLAFCAVINLFGSMTPVADINKRIEAKLRKATDLPLHERLDLYASLRPQQEEALARKPSEPHGWARLAYLRMATQGNDKTAFAALSMSDLVSPYESPLLPERALMWSKYRGAENDEQKDYQDMLWAKSFQMERNATWNIALQHGLIDQVGVSLQKVAPKLYEEWKARKAAKP